jgi:hypothetical protein
MKSALDARIKADGTRMRKRVFDVIQSLWTCDGKVSE